MFCLCHCWQSGIREYSSAQVSPPALHSPNPCTFNHSSPQTVAGMWFGLRLLPSPESQQFAGSGQTAALQTTPCSEQPQVHKCWNEDTAWITITQQYKEGWAALQRKNLREQTGKQKVLWKDSQTFFLDSNLYSKETKADKSVGIKQKLKVRDKVSPAEDSQGENTNLVAII